MVVFVMKSMIVCYIPNDRMPRKKKKKAKKILSLRSNKRTKDIRLETFAKKSTYYG